jgi:hypothetical protein
MKMMRPCLHTVAVAVALAATACATMTVSSHVEPGLETAQYRTFDWGPADSLPVGDARLDRDPFFNDQMHGAIERGLALQGFTLAEPGGSPDLLIHYHANISQRIDVGAADQEFEFCAGEGCDPLVTVYEAGTLVIDIVDARTNRVIWRGWAQDGIQDELADPQRMEALIEQAVARMLARFPGRR